MAMIRLDKYLADAGAGSRAKVKELVKGGHISINGTVIKKPDVKVDTETDVVYLDKRALSYSEFQYFMLNKPKGVVSATTDDRDKTVIDLITEKKRRDLFPVGRLDKDTEGLLIITNDGKLANSLLTPGKHVDKRYYAEVCGRADEELKKRFAEGVDIGDDAPTKPAGLEIIRAAADKSEVYITITEGRYHQIKRMFSVCGMKVQYLKRLSMGAVSLDEKLGPGEYRRLNEKEIELLKRNT